MELQLLGAYVHILADTGDKSLQSFLIGCVAVWKKFRFWQYRLLFAELVKAKQLDQSQKRILDPLALFYRYERFWLYEKHIA